MPDRSDPTSKVKIAEINVFLIGKILYSFAKRNWHEQATKKLKTTQLFSRQKGDINLLGRTIPANVVEAVKLVDQSRNYCSNHGSVL